MISEIYNKAEILTHFVIFCDTTRIDKKKKVCQFTRDFLGQEDWSDALALAPILPTPTDLI